jgi:uncharacterized protein (DUF488 family)
MTAIFTIGHSTRHIDKFIGILQFNKIEMVIDVRSIPHSEHNPQFDEYFLEKKLKNSGIKYVHMKDLGGFRKPLEKSENPGWENPGFRGYADYMQTPDFRKAIDKLLEFAKKNSVVIMCSEGNPFKCHRLLVSDALKARGIKVLHITTGTSGKEHVLTDFAKVSGLKVTYPNHSADQDN